MADDDIDGKPKGGKAKPFGFHRHSFKHEAKP